MMDIAKTLFELMKEKLPYYRKHVASCQYSNHEGREHTTIFLHLPNECEVFNSYTKASDWIYSKESVEHKRLTYQKEHEVLFRKFTI